MEKGITIDRYKLNLYCRCLDCKKYNDIPAHSCKKYPKRDGIPSKVWNGKNEDCEFFEAKS